MSDKRHKDPLYTEPTAFGAKAVTSVWDGGPERQLEIISYAGREFMYRPHCCDFATLTDIAKRRIYERHRSIEPDDVWLDGGANIGAFSVIASGQCDRVVAVEPEPTNFDLLKRNLHLNDCQNVVVIRAALVADDTQSVTLYQNVTGNTGSHSLYVKRGRPGLKVPARNIVDLIEQYGVNCLKLDIEGAEREIIPSLPLGSLRALAMEYHFNACRDRDHSNYREMVKLLADHFPHTRFNPDPPMHNWFSLVYCWR